MFRALGAWQDETDSDEQIVSDSNLKDYQHLIAEWAREWVKKQKEKGEVYGTKKQREYAARWAAYERAGEPANVNWVKPGSIRIPYDIQKEYGLVKPRKL